MKKTIFALSLMAAAVIGCAPANADTQPVDVANSCSSISTLAETIMTSRQAGVPMRDIVAIANGNSTVELIIQQAYSQSLWRSKDLSNELLPSSVTTGTSPVCRLKMIERGRFV